jgi:hypothetical protein
LTGGRKILAGKAAIEVDCVYKRGETKGNSTMGVKKMVCKSGVGAALIALALLGCKGVQPTAAASGAGTGAVASNGDGSGASGADNGATRIEYITDPTMNNMKVMPVQVPASWKFRGVLVPPGTCTDTSEVFRSTSPDGHSFVEVMPRMGWRWGNLWAGKDKAGCLPFDKPVSALEFVKYMTTTLQVEYLQEQPVPGYSGPRPYPGGVQTLASATVRFKNGSVNMMGSVMAGLFCSQYPAAGNQAAPNRGPGYPAQQNGRPGLQGGHCDAVVTYITAPESQFADVIKIWSAPGMGRHRELDDWVAIFSQRYANALQARTNIWLNESNNAFAARQQMYKDQAAVQQQAHDQFLRTLQAGTDSSMANAARIANSNHTMASDMVDYSLDRTTIMDTNTGAIYKTSNQITPGGAAVQVHGDGTPIH